MFLLPAPAELLHLGAGSGVIARSRRAAAGTSTSGLPQQFGNMYRRTGPPRRHPGHVVIISVTVQLVPGMIAKGRPEQSRGKVAAGAGAG
jgi:hypothetical protein